MSELPFIQLFDYGKNLQGYWTYKWMVIQLEDCIDVLQSLHPQYNYVFMFDHSCGHDRKHPDGLNAAVMNKGFGRNQPIMHSVKMELNDQLGTTETATIAIGATQHLVFLKK